MRWAATFVATGAAVFGLALATAYGADAETGPRPVYDQVCMNPAYRNATHGVGMAANNDKRCAEAKHPESYGSGPK